MENIKINTEYIKLDQFLKYVSLISSGADAKIIIKEGNVKVNDEVELQRGKKLRSGDTIEYNGKSFRIE